MFLMQLLSLHSDCTMVSVTLIPPPMLICLQSMCIVFPPISWSGHCHCLLHSVAVLPMLRRRHCYRQLIAAFDTLPLSFAELLLLWCADATLHYSSYCCHDRVDHSCCRRQQQLRQQQQPHYILIRSILDR